MHARVAVIGAGAIGCAVALQLARGGIDDVVVIDRNAAAGMGSTGRANGGVRAQFTTPVNIAFSRHTIAGLAALDGAGGGTVGYRSVGYLFLSGTDAGAETLVSAMRTQQSLGVAVRRLSSDEVHALVPCLRVEGLQVASFCATDGIIDPHGVASALCHEARRLGCTFRFDAEVRALEPRGDSVVVRSTDGDVSADVVVNAAGPQARAVAALAGVDLPVLPYRRNLVCTEPVAGLPDRLPMCVDADTGVLIRREGAGVLIAWSPHDDQPTEDTSFDPHFLEEIAERIGNRFPFLADAVVNPRKCWAGSYPETPDHHAIIDAPAHLPWFVQCAGFGGHGIMHSLAAGQAVTELIRDQRCSTFDIAALALDRFDGPSVVETAVL